MTKKAVVGGIIGGFVLLLAFNNCSSQMSFTSQSEDEPSKSAGNGTPYGGKLKPGNYYDPNPSECNSSLNDYIAVSVDPNVEEASVTLVDVCNSSNTGSLNESELSVSDENTVAYQGQLFLHESETIHRDESSVIWSCVEGREAQFSIFAYVSDSGPTDMQVNYYLYAEGGLLISGSYDTEEVADGDRFTYVSQDQTSGLSVDTASPVEDGFDGSMGTPETEDLGSPEVNLFCYGDQVL